MKLLPQPLSALSAKWFSVNNIGKKSLFQKILCCNDSGSGIALRRLLSVAFMALFFFAAAFTLHGQQFALINNTDTGEWEIHGTFTSSNFTDPGTKFYYDNACPASYKTQIWHLADFDFPNTSPNATIDFSPVPAMTPAAAVMTPQESPAFITSLYIGLVKSAPVSSFDQPSHQQNLINYYNNTLAPDLALTSFTNNGQRISVISHLNNLLRNTGKWVTDTALKTELDSLLGATIVKLP